MRITCLLENTAVAPAVAAEHGLSLHIETADRRILFDMGQTDLFARNAEALGINLADVDTAILSHGHNDHGGGLKTFLEINRHAPVYVHRDAFLPHYNASGSYIGLDTALSDHPRIRFTGDRTEVGEGLTLLTCNGLERPNSPGHFGLTERVGDAWIPDDFRHEQYLLIREGGRRVLISGCSHKGIGDLTEWFSPDVLVGGFHVSKMPPDHRLERIAKLLNTHPTRFYTCHCTGTASFGFMRERMERLDYLSCGQTITI
jgi:7,8-dihydropterin-6-yl-methyl-4-(beta-D-ribofuranosyl)aminobenzene 5'-phosphate synthase